MNRNIKNFITLPPFLTLCLILLSLGQTIQAQQDQNMQGKIKALMAKMTLEDKVGEMTQLAINTISMGEGYSMQEPHQLDPADLKKVLLDLRVGSILNVADHAYTKEHWHEIITAIQEVATKEKPTGIPVLYGIDAIHGNNYTLGSTLFPQQINLAAGWNPELAEKIAAITAYETRASWIPWNFSPVLDIGRDPRWPRFWETFGEDVLLASDMGEAFIRGSQGDDPSAPDKLAACMKHFLGYSGPVSGKDRTQALIPERQLREYYLPTFQRAIQAGALTVMINSGEMNGIPVHCNKAILTDLLRTELGFKGLAVSDWEDIGYLQTRHRVAKDYKDAIRLAINAGIDMAMVPMDLKFPILLKELVEEGAVPMSRIDESVERILKVKYQLGLFEAPYHENYDYSKFGSEEHTAVSLEAALESITLLKNEQALPLAKNSKVLVTGPTANAMMCLNGGWSRTWQGNSPKWDAEDNKKTILEAIQDKIGKDQVTYHEGATYDKLTKVDAVTSAAANVDAVIVCLGEMPYTETPGDIEDLHLPVAQQQLVEAVAKSGKPVIVVLVEGRPRLISRFEDKATAILDAYLPGNEGGRAIAELLFGDANPSGKLPFTYPREANALLNYDHRGTDLAGPLGFNPQFEFGFGLSYTTFEYSELKLDRKELTEDGAIEISVQVKNTGDRVGREVVQLYITDKVASITPAVKRLRGYQKITLKPGESKQVNFSIKSKNLAFVGVDNKWVTEVGDFEISIGGLKETLSFK
ncbi:MAG: glycosyl hydrolase [Saprospiraceae bacterium]|nr:MAG: glycosyl hydrolase [Saprospiraceae bacterium]